MALSCAATLSGAHHLSDYSNLTVLLTYFKPLPLAIHRILVFRVAIDTAWAFCRYGLKIRLSRCQMGLKQQQHHHHLSPGVMLLQVAKAHTVAHSVVVGVQSALLPDFSYYSSLLSSGFASPPLPLGNFNNASTSLKCLSRRSDTSCSNTVSAVVMTAPAASS